MWLIGCILAVASALYSPPSPAGSPQLTAVLDYRPEKCAYCGTETWCERRANGQRQCRGCKAERFFERVLLQPLGYRLLDWQRKDLRAIFGTVSQETGRRRYDRAFLSEAKKNGKTFIVGGVPLYGLVMEPHLRKPIKIFGGAGAKDQAGLVFQAAQTFVAANPALQRQLKVVPTGKRIVRRDGGGFYAVLSADGDVQDGVEPYISIRDELHRWNKSGAESLRDAMTKGQVAQDEPLDIVITTAGAEYESPLWLEEYEHAKDVAEGRTEDPGLYVSIYEPDLKRIASEPDYWKSREVRVAGNPSHEDRGGFLQDEKLVKELRKALRSARAKQKYLRFNLNVPTKTLDEPVIEMDAWQACGGGVDLRRVDHYDLDTLIEQWGLKNQRCWAGVDASWTTDFTGLTAVFPPFKGCDLWTLLAFCWVPEGLLAALEHQCRVPLSTWVAQGFVTATPGNAIDMRSVVERIKWLRDRFDLIEVPFDRTNFRTQAMDLRENSEIETWEVPQNYMELGYPTKWLLAAYQERQIRHGNNPALNWMAGCLQLKYDDHDNCQPAKPKRLKNTKRIDLMQAAITGLNRALLAAENTPRPITAW